MLLGGSGTNIGPYWFRPHPHPHRRRQQKSPARGHLKQKSTCLMIFYNVYEKFKNISMEH